MSQKNKNLILLAGLLLLLIVAYRFSFQNTIQTYGEVQKLKQQIQTYQGATQQIALLKAKEKQYDSILAGNNMVGTSLQNNLLKMLNEASESPTKSTAKSSQGTLKIINFETPHTYTDPTTESQKITYNFTLQGSYPQILNTLYQLEQQYSFGTILHTNFQKQKNYRTRRSYLECQVLLQRVE